MAKDFRYRGYSLEELQQMPLEEFAKLLKARARRSLLRILNWEKTRFNKKEYMIKSNEIVKFYKKAEEAAKQLKEGKKPKPLRTHRRDVIILPYMVGLRIEVHNGKEFKSIEITPEMIGYRLGDFVLTRKEVIHKGLGGKK